MEFLFSRWDTQRHQSNWSNSENSENFNQKFIKLERMQSYFNINTGENKNKQTKQKPNEQ